MSLPGAKGVWGSQGLLVTLTVVAGWDREQAGAQAGFTASCKRGESSRGWSPALLPLIFSTRKVRMAPRLLVSAVKSG